MSSNEQFRARNENVFYPKGNLADIRLVARTWPGENGAERRAGLQKNGTEKSETVASTEMG
jgi:hypothetical protein